MPDTGTLDEPPDERLPAGRGTSIAPAARARRANAPPRIFILSSVRLYREGVVLMLSRTGAVEIIGAGAPPDAAARIAELRPDVVVLDASSENGLALARQVRDLVPGSKIVAFALSGVDQDVIACAEAGISAFVTRDGSPEDLIDAVHQAMRGELVCSPRLTALLLGRVATLSAQRMPTVAADTLTQREREVGLLVEQGLSNKEIARRLRVGTATVKNHVHNILEKLRVRRRGEVAARLRSEQLPGAAARAPAHPMDDEVR